MTVRGINEVESSNRFRNSITATELIGSALVPMSVGNVVVAAKTSANDVLL
jgi:hypothetical protein